MNDLEVTIVFYSGKTIVLRAEKFTATRYTSADSPGYSKLEWSAPKSKFDLFSIDPARIESVTAVPWTMFSKEGVS